MIAFESPAGLHVTAYVESTNPLRNMQSDVSPTLVTQWDVRGSFGSDLHPQSCVLDNYSSSIETARALST